MTAALHQSSRDEVPSQKQPAPRQWEHSLGFTAQVTPSGAIGRMPIVAGMLNPFGVVHAGALVWFADVVATCAAGIGTVRKEDGAGFPLAVTLNAQLLRNRNSGNLLATATAVRRGRRITVIRTEVCDEAGSVLLDLTSTHTPAELAVQVPLSTEVPVPSASTHLQVHQLSRLVSRLYDAELAPIGIKTTQLSFLEHLANMEPTCAADLAEALAMDASTVARNLRTILSHGWASQEIGADPRQKILHLTPSGKKMLLNARKRCKVAQESVQKKLAPADLSSLHSALASACERFQRKGQ